MASAYGKHTRIKNYAKPFKTPPGSSLRVQMKRKDSPAMKPSEKQVKGLSLPRRRKRLDEVSVWLEDSGKDYTAAVNLAKHWMLRFTVKS